MNTLEITAQVIAAVLIITGFLWGVARGIIKLVRFGIRVERSLIAVETELRPNGGGSLRDRVDQLNLQHQDIMNALTGINNRLNIVEDHQ